MRLSRLVPAALLLLAALPANAHEFWIEPFQYQVDSGERLQGHFKNGQEFEGTTLSYFDRSSSRYEMASAAGVVALTPRSGDNPALDVAAPAEGLVVVAHETTPSTVTYTEWPKFLNFLAHKDHREGVQQHRAAGWPTDRFQESYTRHVKALFAVGDGAGSDQEMGLATEFVALTNPYAAGFEGPMRMRLLHEGAPRGDAQVEVFERAPSGAVAITLHRTDAEGLAEIPVQPGHEYLLDAVVIQPLGAEDPEAPVWQSLWAGMTFKVPAD